MNRIPFWRYYAIALVTALSLHAFADTVADSLTNGINSNYWAVRTNTGLFTINAGSNGVSISKSNGSVTSFQAALLASKLVAQGNFDIQIAFTNLNLTNTSGTSGNQLQLNTRFGGQDFFTVRGSEAAFGQNAHAYTIPPATVFGEKSWTTNFGTLRVVRNNALVQAYIDSSLLYQSNFNTNDATFSIVLQNNATPDGIAATFRNFQLTADRILPLSTEVSFQMLAPTNFALSWKDVSWPDTLQGYEVQVSTNLATGWQTLTNPLNSVANQFFLTNSSTVPAKFFRLEQGPESYH